MLLLQLRCCRCSRVFLKPLCLLSNSSFVRCKTTRNHYEVLGVSQNATQEQIKTAFLELSKKLHPDQNPDANSHEKFVEINSAYMVLGKPASRKDYDMQMRFSSHPFFSDSYGSRPYGPYDGPYRSPENDPYDIPYWKKDPFSDHGYQFEQMRREREWREKFYSGRYESRDPEQHPYAVWVRLPIGLFYLAFILLILKTYRDNPEKFRSRATREKILLQELEDASLRRQRAETEELGEKTSSTSEKPFYVVRDR